MHMADALISPEVGGVMLAATVGIGAYALRKTYKEDNAVNVPMMGVMGAFVFASQMINFSIPGTGSSGHIGGGILLASMLGPNAGFLTMAVILLIQAFFFGDGGLLAYGYNVFNMGFFACMLAYSLIFLPLVRKEQNVKRIWIASILATVVGLQLGAFSVTVETLLSGKTELPFGMFVGLMQPIHLAIGIIEGAITAAVLTFVHSSHPQLLNFSNTDKKAKLGANPVLIILTCAALVIGGFVSWYASSDPDGLEWAIENVAGKAELVAEGGAYDISQSVQDSGTFLPDYNFPVGDVEPSQMQENLGTSVAGVTGAAITAGFLVLIGFAIAFFKRKKKVQGTV